MFVGIGRGVIRRELTRKNAATLVGVTYDEFRKRFGWDNLYGEEMVPAGLARAQSDAEDRRRADLLHSRLAGYERVVLLGTRVASALAVEGRPLYEWFLLDEGSPLLVARMPHTSEVHWNTTGRGQTDYWEPARTFARSLLEL